MDPVEYREEWAPRHGGGGGQIHAFVCPNEGVIVGISFTAGQYLDTIRFTCESRAGLTTFGPFGGDINNLRGHDMCDRGMYISSILGRAGQGIDQIAIRCVRPGTTGITPGRHGHGGESGSPFDDQNYSVHGHRPVEIRVWAGDRVDGIQIKYANLPAYFLDGFGQDEMVDLPGYGDNKLENDNVDGTIVLPEYAKYNLTNVLMAPQG